MQEPEEALPDRESPGAEAQPGPEAEPAEVVKPTPPVPRPARDYPPRPKR